MSAYDAAVDLRVLVQNVGGQAAARIASACLQREHCDVYGFVETMLVEDTVSDVEHLLPGFDVWHCVRPRPAAGRPHGGISVFVRKGTPWHPREGCMVRPDPAAGIIWLECPSYQLTLAVCYFSPHNSQVYQLGHMHSDPMSVLFAGLREAEAKGHKHLVMGDLNVRIGRLSCDVPNQLSIPPLLEEPSTLPDLHHLAAIPRQRTSMDMSVPCRQRAEAFLSGLFSASSVVLNGRARGDEGGSHTCWSISPAGVVLGHSTVDYACVSAALFRAVECFAVLPFRPSASKDHSALYVHLTGLPPGYSAVRPRPPVKVVRPKGSAYLTALRHARPQFEALLHAWHTGGVSVASAVQQFTDLLVSCAREHGVPPGPATGSPGRPRSQPWYDDECRALARALDEAWGAWHASRGGIYGSLEGCQVARAALQQARRVYKLRCKEKKCEHQLRCQVAMLEAYFGPEQKNYWRAFFASQSPPLPLSDVAAWTEYFAALLGAPVEPLALDPGDEDLRQQLYAVCPKGQADQMAVLNDVVSFEEAQCCMGLPKGKSADLQGLTGELLCLAASVEPDPTDPAPVCPPAIKCAQWLLQSMLDGACVPDSMCTSKLVPVPKAKDPAALLDRDMHRGISVSPVFARLLERMMNKRLERLVTQLHLRSPTQCGFRPGHGTLDAIFTLQHLIHSTQHHRGRLYVVFVDFRKAFDMVRRDLLLERCRQLGIHGPFMALLVKLYDTVCSRLLVNGQLGGPITTTTGTKQGSELSPLLFGLFVELLHDMFKLRLPGAGPVLSGMHVPDIMYADDVALVSTAPEQAQQLLDVLDVFCRLFGMEVNLAPHKTCVVVFRRARTAVPAGFRLTYRGCQVAVQREYTYLGVRVHETRGLAGAGAGLAASGSKAMHAVLSRCRKSNLTQFDIKLRMFDVLVEPVLSYASHIWGPLAFQRHLIAGPYATDAEKVHTSYLRIMTGAGRSASLDVLYRDLHRLPIMYHWVVLAVRWWNRMSAAQGGQMAMACCAWLEDVKLALAGCSACWSSMLLHTLSSLQLLDSTWKTQGLEWVLGQRWEETDVKKALSALFHARWRGPFDADPRLAPSQGVAMCQHSRWVYPVDPDVDFYARAAAPKHTKLCLPFVRLRTYAQLRVGYAHLEVEQGRKRWPVTPRAQRTCKLCSGDDAQLSFRQRVLLRTGRADNVEDLKHFLLECPVYDDLRAACAAFPSDIYSRLNDPTCMADVFGHDDQAALANTLYRMKVRRAELLGLSVGI